MVTDEFPCFFLPKVVGAAGRRITVRLETVDSNGLLPLASVPQAYPAAVHLRRFMQRDVAEPPGVGASEPPFSTAAARLPRVAVEVRSAGRGASPELLEGSVSALASLPIDHAVPCVANARWISSGTARTSHVRQRRCDLSRASAVIPTIGARAGCRRTCTSDTSRRTTCSHAVMRHEQWKLGKLGPKPTGAREGWWGVGAGAEAFLDQFVVWRELAFNTCAKRPDDYNRFEGLPAWAQQRSPITPATPRPYRVRPGGVRAWRDARSALERRAARARRNGWMHNYMRMLWGKKILEWSASPREALHTMIAIMDRWALDGRDPNSYAGYMWTLGRTTGPGRSVRSSARSGR